MTRWFNIGGPCVRTKHYMLPAAERLPEVMSLIRKKQYFLVHAQRQCGKTTAFQALKEDINAKGEMVALYCSVEVAQELIRPEVGIPAIANMILLAVDYESQISDRWGGLTYEALKAQVVKGEYTSVILRTLNLLARLAGKPLVIFFDEVDCLSAGTLLAFLSQLRDGCISCCAPGSFPVSIALIGLRNIRDYRMRIRPESQFAGETCPFNVITKAVTLRLFTEEEVRTLYRQHTEETGQAFEEEALAKAWDYSRGQPWLVNALARWCVEKIHHEDFSKPVTGADMDEAREQLILEEGVHLDYLMEKARDPRLKPLVEAMLTGADVNRSDMQEDITYGLELGLFVDERGVLKPANPIYQETIGRYLSRGTQDSILMRVPENPWVKEDGLDMDGLMAAFQQFWRENASEDFVPFKFREAYPHLVLQAFLQRVINGGGQIIREMALGRERLDLGVKFRGAVYAVEVKTLAFYEKSHEKAYLQVCDYMDTLGVQEGWLVVADSDLIKPWEDKISTTHLRRGNKTIHLVRC